MFINIKHLDCINLKLFFQQFSINPQIINEELVKKNNMQYVKNTIDHFLI